MAVIEENDAQSALTQLRAYLTQRQLPVNSRLPTERELCRALGVTRTAVRKALATLEAEGQLWRHVGKGTFVGTRPIEDLTDIATITRLGPAAPQQATARSGPSQLRRA